MLVKKWWDIYNDESLDFKGENPVSEEQTFSKSSIMASMPEPTISYIPAPTAAWVLTNKKRELPPEPTIFFFFLSSLFYTFSRLLGLSLLWEITENTFMKLLNICDLINIVRSIPTWLLHLKLERMYNFCLDCISRTFINYMYILNVMYMHASLSLSLSPFPTLFFSLILEHTVCDDTLTCSHLLWISSGY